MCLARRLSVLMSFQSTEDSVLAFCWRDGVKHETESTNADQAHSRELWMSSAVLLQGLKHGGCQLMGACRPVSVARTGLV